MSVRILRPFPVSSLGIYRSIGASAHHLQTQQWQQRSLSSPSGATGSSNLSASRTLPYSALSIFELITDINSYPAFLPYCRKAQVLTQSKPDEHYQRRWPQTASLTVGFNHDTISETFDSKIWCVPPIPEKGRSGVGIVESASGSDATHTPEFAIDDHVGHHDSSADSNANMSDSPLSLLRARWELRAYPHKPGPEDGKRPQETNIEPSQKAHERTDVSLHIEYKFRSPVYDMMSKTVAGKAAEMMVEAFEKRANEVLKQ
ncbi:MAG: putative secondary metabolism biosynthetic enzyme [Chrysothrix sp. TS-e1954]|nr:MAG: putative secondary metabolism biosynthetic enzyme [Chrysothrix sp. TS-e1954]